MTRLNGWLASFWRKVVVPGAGQPQQQGGFATM